MKKTIITIASALLLLSSASAQEVLPFRNPELPREERINDLISRLTLQEKVGMMMHGSKGVERLGIPDYNWWNEALHGVARAGLATVYPQTIGMAATFDPQTHLQTFTYVSDEARAKYNDAVSRGEYKQYYGLTFWTPNINIFRDPRWGRGQETYGEDPFLTSVMGVATVKGLQGDNPDYYKTHACAKHFAVHSGPEWNRHSFDVVVSSKDLWETYLPAFESLVKEGDVREFMGAYNSYDGDPCCGSAFLMKDVLRGKWNYQGLVVSDCWAINDFFVVGHHESHPDAASASAAAVLTGTDIECGSAYVNLVSAVEEGLITEKDIDVSIRRILNGLFELGFFDPASMVPWSTIPYSNVDSQEHKDHALKVARQSVVLLKNEGDVLPVRPSDVKKIAVVGPNATDDKMMLGNYNGTPSHTVTILEGIKEAYPDAEVTYERGCDLVEGYVYVDPRLQRGFRAENYEGLSAEQMAEIRKMEAERQALLAAAPKPIPSENYTPEALAEFAAKTAEGSDVIFFVGGLAPTIEGEEMRVTLDGFKGGDRERIELPEVQGKMLKALKATGKPVVFILCSGSAVALEQNEGDYDALVCAWYGGQAGGTAVGDIVSGKVSPSGRLPITFYKSTAQLPDFLDYNMKGRTYRYMTEAPLYPFGYGLSYADFSYEGAKLSSKSVKAGDSVTVTVTLKNDSDVASDEVVQVYVKRLDDENAPIKALKGFQRVSMNAGETKKVSIELPASSFEYYDSTADDLVVKPGKYQILYGSSSADADLKALNFTIK
ncbi:MAG: glycoside hydrolase family 3 C-terminal domain-containing protein [Bacteroidales bacterium]|nr:glycoside hydrolase family 3 C-terminal domain-containing protein [Bacteroidales bacterium]